MVKLKSGKEVETKLLTLRQRARIKDMSVAANNKMGVVWSFENNLDLVLMATGLKEVELNDWSEEEIDEVAAHIFSENFPTELDKKKLK